MSIYEMLIVAVALTVGFGLVVFIHELGHFLMARRAGICVEVFSIGFGPRLISFTRGETTYQWSLLPFGGYVKMVGEDPEDDSGAIAIDGYSQQSLADRFGVVIAGPLMNILLACLLMPLVFMVGRERPVYEQQPPVLEHIVRNTAVAVAGIPEGARIAAVNGTEVNTWEQVQDALILAGAGDVSVRIAGDTREWALPNSFWGRGLHPLTALTPAPIIGEVSPGLPAAEAGLQAGDRVVALGGYPIETWSELSVTTSRGRSLWFWLWAQRAWEGDFADAASYLRGGPLAVDYERDGQRARAFVEPERSADGERIIMGIRATEQDLWSAVPMQVRRYGLLDSVQRGSAEVWRMVELTGKFLQRLVSEPQHHYESLAGPVRIVSMFAQIAQEGLSPFLYFLAFFNLQLGLLNLMPIPVLDGGHIIFLGIEWLRGKPVSLRARAIAQQIGMALLLTMLFMVTLNDLSSMAWVQAIKKAIFG